LIRVSQSIGEFILKNRAAGRVATRLKNRPQSLPRKTNAQGFNRLTNCCWMMREIVNHRHAADFSAHLHPPLDARERVKRQLDLRVRQPYMPGYGNDSQRIAHIQFTAQGNTELKIINREARPANRKFKSAGTHLIRCGQSKTPQRAMWKIEQRRKIGVIAIGQQQAVTGN